MNFNSIYFLFLLLPICLILFYVANERLRNLVLLFASLIFFVWGQWFYLPLMIILILLNFLAGIYIDHFKDDIKKSRTLLLLIVTINITVLVFFKAINIYGINWLKLNIDPNLLNHINQNLLPLGISYITFQLIAYQLDINNRVCGYEKNFINFSTYILLFPKIIVGPIVRYRSVKEQLIVRKYDVSLIANGARRFVQGLAKKILIADQIAKIVNPAFGLPGPSFSTPIAWLVLIGYSLQLYFDFSGYTDMAIGLGQMFGFTFMENFNYPYISKSISEFWRRWHISLSSWFRDYVFYPLERKDRRAEHSRQPLNILFIFLLTGLWHGLTINFVIWGLIHGLAISLETLWIGKWLKKVWAPFQHLYALIIILFGWVFFRSSTPLFALQFLARLAGSQQGISPVPFMIMKPLPIIEPSIIAALILAVIFSIPVFPWLQKLWLKLSNNSPVLSITGMIGVDLFILFLLVSSIAAMISSTYVANIYGKF
jgi:alginate O-acetyltransferase complex protein AlgI